MRTNFSYTRLIASLTLVLILAISLVFLAPRMSKPAQYSGQITYLDQKIGNVMELAAGSTAASVVVSAIPGDTATPIAEKLADFSGYFMIVLCALYLEKFLLIIFGYLSFGLFIPAGCILLIVGLYRKPAVFHRLALKLLSLTLAILLMIPVSISTSRIIEDTFHVSAEDFVESTDSKTDEIREEVGGEEYQTVWDKITDTVDTLSGLAADCVSRAKDLLTEFVNSLAVMIVTSCLIPLLVLLILSWIVKMILGVNTQNPNPALPPLP